MELLTALFDPWAWRMAWRDSRNSRRRLALYAASITVGVAALVAIGSYGDNMRAAVASQARELLGADLRLSSNEAFPEEVEDFIAERLVGELGAEPARMITFSSMAYFADSDQARLVRVRAVEGDYPFYGEILSEPPEAARDFREGARALVDPALMAQFGARAGDTVRIGSRDYVIAGSIVAVPGESAANALFGPRLYLQLSEVDPDLLVRGSRARREAFFRFEPAVDADAERLAMRDMVRKHRMRATTVNSRREGWEESLDDLVGFLNLVSFVALLLGGLGVGSAMHVYVRHKLGAVAVLRCLGAPTSRAFAVYLIQTAVLAALGAAIGAVLGVAIQRLIPAALSELLPLDVEPELQPAAILEGALVGWIVALLFAALPLLAVRRVPPLAALRAVSEPGRDRLRWLIYGLILTAIAVFAWRQTDHLGIAAGFAGGVSLVFGLLALVAKGIAAVMRRVVPRRWPYVLRQGLANLHRPHNQTSLIMVSLGLGTFLILTLLLTQDTLLDQVSFSSAGDLPNVVMFDIQSDQEQAVATLVQDMGLPVRQRVPVVNMRISSVRGTPAEELLGRVGDDIPGWVLRREYRSTYRSFLEDTEELLDGELQTGPWDGEGPVPVSIAESIAEDLKLGLGDEVVFDVAGVPVETVIGSVRRVDWRRVQTNFFFVFPEGVLEQAPQFHVVVTRADSPEDIASLQREMALAFPNVSIIDVTLILQVADAILSRVAFVIRFMAAFSVVAGILVLFSAVVVTRAQRTEESVLLRTLGATRAQVLGIMNVEYVMLGVLATLTGASLAVGGGWALATWVFDAPFSPSWLALLTVAAVVCGLTWGIGRIHSRGIHARPPLEVLRSEI